MRKRHALGVSRERDKPRQGAVASSLELYRNGAVGFIDWLDADGSTRPRCRTVKKTMSTHRSTKLLIMIMPRTRRCWGVSDSYRAEIRWYLPRCRNAK